MQLILLKKNQLCKSDFLSESGHESQSIFEWITNQKSGSQNWDWFLPAVMDPSFFLISLASGPSACPPGSSCRLVIPYCYNSFSIIICNQICNLLVTLSLFLLSIALPCKKKKQKKDPQPWRHQDGCAEQKSLCCRVEYNNNIYF